MRTDDAIRERSGNVSSSDPLVSFLYELMRNHLSPGTVEGLVRNSLSETIFTNGWLAHYAKDLASSLKAGSSDEQILVTNTVQKETS